MKRNTLSVHVHTLARAGLVSQWRETMALSRSVAFASTLADDFRVTFHPPADLPPLAALRARPIASQARPPAR